MQPDCSQDNINPVLEALSGMDAVGHLSDGTRQRVMDLLEIGSRFNRSRLEKLPAIAFGADRILIEVHSAPRRVWGDGEQVIDFDAFRIMVQKLRALAAACGREL